MPGRQAVSLEILLRYHIAKDISISYHIMKILKVPIPTCIGDYETYLTLTISAGVPTIPPANPAPAASKTFW